jgi:hypothetical protein
MGGEMTKFKKRYVLAKGYPWAFGGGNYKTIGMGKDKFGVNLEPIQFPPELWSVHLPKYRLVLERVR